MLAKDIIYEGITGLYIHRKAILRALLIPFLLVAGLDVVNATIDNNHPYRNICELVIECIQPLIQVYIAIVIHRTIILSEASPAFKLGRFFMYLLYLMAIGLMLIPVIFLGLLPYGVILAVIYGSLILTVFSLILPSIAVDQKITFAELWGIAKQRLSTLFICVILVTVITNIPSYIYSNYLNLHLIADLYDWLAIVVDIAILSAAYKTIVHTNCGIISTDSGD